MVKRTRQGMRDLDGAQKNQRRDQRARQEYCPLAHQHKWGGLCVVCGYVAPSTVDD